MKFLTLLIVLGCCLAACEEAPETIPEELTLVETYMIDPVAVARGEAIFVGSCMDYCHTREPAETDASFLFDCAWQQSVDDESIAETIRSGIPNTRMVGFGSNFPGGEEDMWKLIAYLRVNQFPCAAP